MRFASLLLLLFLVPFAAADPPDAMPRPADSVLDDPVFQREAQRGLDLLYNLEFERAQPVFDALARRHPDHPVGAFLQALVPWWRILLDLNSTEHDDAFLDALEETVERADRLLRRDRRNLDAIFFKGAALGFRGRHLANRRSYWKAAWAGKGALDYVLALNRREPARADFGFGTGIYDYYAAVIPERYPWSRPFVALFPDGDKGRGLAALHRAFRDGVYIRTEAAYFLLQIYYLYERDYAKSLQFISWLREEHPDNAFFHAMEGRIYFRFGVPDRGVDVFREVLARFEAGKTGYNAAAAEQALYFIGRRAMDRQRDAEAERAFARLERLARKNPNPTIWQTAGRLRHAMLADARGDRQAAVRRYREVLRLRDAWGAHEDARRYLKQPFAG
jgi:tetratricopeptide (TPR) repeat protein